MTDEDVRQIVSGRQQRLCARVRQGPDGTVMPRNSSLRFSIVMRRISRVLAHRTDSRDKRGSGAGKTAAYYGGAKVIPNPTEANGISIGCS